MYNPFDAWKDLKCTKCIHGEVCMQRMGGANLSIAVVDCEHFKDASAKKLSIKNLTIDIADVKQKEDYEKAVYRAFESVSPEEGPVYLVKVKVGDIPVEKVIYILRQIKEDLIEQGLTNCVFVPIHPQGIQDIIIESLEYTNEERV
jgi:hypothetical protein